METELTSAALEFNPADHSYMRAGVRLVSVTQVCSILLDHEYPEGAAARGTAVHLACQYLDEGDLDEATVPDGIRGYLDAYRKFLAESGWTWTGIEVRMAHPKLGYAGTVDRVPDAAVLDIKSGVPEPWHAIQLAAYLAMLDNPMARRRYALYLSADGTYGVKEYPRQEFPRDWAVFQSALNVYNWRGRKGNAGGSHTG